MITHIIVQELYIFYNKYMTIRLSKPLRWATQKTNSPSQEETEIRVHSFGSAAQVTSMIFEDRQPAKPIGCARIWKLFSGIIHHLRRLH